ncbi:hypothetical protein XELAEV_18003641mg [Xenopus laevis]|nr:hypothetical protein XELAEV_18003641mg [Xenopus laevis]
MHGLPVRSRNSSSLPAYLVIYSICQLVRYLEELDTLSNYRLLCTASHSWHLILKGISHLSNREEEMTFYNEVPVTPAVLTGIPHLSAPTCCSHRYE